MICQRCYSLRGVKVYRVLNHATGRLMRVRACLRCYREVWL